MHKDPNGNVCLTTQEQAMYESAPVIRPEEFSRLAGKMFDASARLGDMAMAAADYPARGQREILRTVIGNWPMRIGEGLLLIKSHVDAETQNQIREYLEKILPDDNV